MSVSADIKKMFQDLIVPELTGIKTAQEQSNVEMKSFKNEMKTGIQRLDEKVGSVRNEISSFRGEFKSEIKRLDEKLETAIQVRERLVALESKMSVLGH